MVNDKQVEETARVLVLDGSGVGRLHHGNRFWPLFQGRALDATKTTTSMTGMKLKIAIIKAVVHGFIYAHSYKHSWIN